MKLPLSPPFPPMEARAVDRIPAARRRRGARNRAGPGWMIVDDARPFGDAWRVGRGE